MQWTDDAQKALEKVPGFVRKMARRAVESDVRKNGREEVTVQDVENVQARYLGHVTGAPARSVTRIAVIRCDTVSEVCPGVACMKSFNHHKNHFADYEGDIELVGFFTCGGCPGRRIFRLVDSLLKYGLDVVHLSSCMLLDEEYPRCPHVKQIKKLLEDKGISVVEGTHH